MIRICHVISALGTGGAELALRRLISATQHQSLYHIVVSLTDIGPVGRFLQNEGVQVFALNMTRGNPRLLTILELAKIIRQFDPDILQTWMYHADFFGSLASIVSRHLPVVWNLRHNALSSSFAQKRTVRLGKICAVMSHAIPKRIIACGESVRNSHVKAGFSATKIKVIRNGFNIDEFPAAKYERNANRAIYGIPPDAFVIGFVARYHPVKQFPLFMNAASQFGRENPNAHFVLYGEGVSLENSELNRLVAESGIQSQFHLLGRRSDGRQINATFDVCTQTSASEGFPNALAEAMAAGIPCISTDVGEARYLLGGTGFVVSQHDSAVIAERWKNVMSMSSDAREALGDSARERIVVEFSLKKQSDEYCSLYSEVIAECAA